MQNAYNRQSWGWLNRRLIFLMIRMKIKVLLAFSELPRDMNDTSSVTAQLSHRLSPEIP